jgi:dihydrolipoamide dehydrogenase
MPSKVLIQVADDHHRRHVLAEEGISGADALAVDTAKALAHVRSLRDRFVSSVKDNTLSPLGERLIRHRAAFIEPGLLAVGDGRIRARKVVIATGSRPSVPEPWRRFGDRVLTTDTLFEQPDLPATIAVLGMGAVGLEMGQALSRLGVKVDGFDTLERVGGLADPEINRLAVELLGRDIALHLGAEAQIEERGARLDVGGNGETAVVDKILVSIGRTPNIEGLGLERLGVDLDDKGMPPFDRETLQIDGLPVFIAGDADGDRAILHEASHEGQVAGYNAVHEPAVAFRRRTPLAIAFTDPNICSVGQRWDELEHSDLAVGEARVESGRATIMRREGGLIRVYAEKDSGRLLGAGLIAPHGEHLAHALAWGIQRRLTVFDMLELPFYHPVVEESLQSALVDLAGGIQTETDRPLGLALA